MPLVIQIIFIGFVVGFIARILTPGSNKPSGFVVTTLIGIAGAYLATFIGRTFGWLEADELARLSGMVIGAVIVLFIWNRLVAYGIVPYHSMPHAANAPPAPREK